MTLDIAIQLLGRYWQILTLVKDTRLVQPASASIRKHS